MATIQVDIVSAEKLLFEGQAKFVSLPGSQGELGIYPKHSPLITSINVGSVRVHLADKDHQEVIFVQGGILEVQPNRVTVLADTAIRAQDIDEEKAIKAKKSAQEAMTNKGSSIDYATAQAELAVAIAKLGAIRHLRKSY